MSIVSILEKAKSFIDTPDKWYQGDWSNKDGTCLCTMGAIVKALGDDPVAVANHQDDGSTVKYHQHPSVLFLEKAMSVDYGIRGSVATVNDFDETTHDDIMEYFDKAIELAKAE